MHSIPMLRMKCMHPLHWLLRKLAIIDNDFDAAQPSGKCEARLGGHAGRVVTCATKTNHCMLGSWRCTRHIPQLGTKPKSTAA